MAVIFTLSKITTLIGCGWSVPSAIAFVAGDLLAWCRELLGK